MKFDEFLEWHQKLLSKCLKSSAEGVLGPIDQEDSKDFIAHIETCINAYVEIFESTKLSSKRWNDQIVRLCQLRDQIQNLRTKEKA